MLPKLADFYLEDYLAFCQAIQQPRIFHRKQWEFWAIARAVEKHLALTGAWGLGFGCGDEALPFYFANQGARVLATDLDREDPRARGWLRHRKHISQKKNERICSPEARERVSIDYLDMTRIPKSRDGMFDFIWSACSLEHLGNLEKGLQFIIQAMRCLKEGGIAVHTTEFNVKSDTETVDNTNTVFYRRKDLEELRKRCESLGYHLQPILYEQGEGVRAVRPIPRQYRKIFLQTGDAINPQHYQNEKNQHINPVLQGFEVTSILLSIVK